MDNLIHELLIKKLIEETGDVSFCISQLIESYEKKFPERVAIINLLKDYNLQGKIDNDYAEFILTQMLK